MKENNELIIEKIDNAEKVLVGIGEEFSFEKIDMSGYELYDIYNKKFQEENIESTKWILDIVRNQYITKKLDINNSEIFKAYQSLYSRIKDKDYYIISTNYDNIVERAGFDKEKIVFPCGSRSRMQCLDKCCDELWQSEKIEMDIIEKLSDRKIKLTDIEKPICPNCGKEVAYNVVNNGNYLESGYLDKWDKYIKWTSMTLNKNLCILELGVGIEYPTVIRWPFEKIGYLNNKAYFIRVNVKLYQTTEELAGKSIGINENSINFLKNLNLEKN